ncbi:MAG: redoxin domain-containing protein [Williamsia sp.]|nr:redoxin domain-containing protein [Williamsia sp.]
MMEVGQKAPNFTLYDTEKTQVSLDSLRGKKVVLLFFPLAFTSVCTKELCNVRDNITEYADTNATVLGISVDSVYTLAKFKEEQQLNFPLLSDFNKEVSKKYDALYDNFAFDMKGVSKRAAYVIDTNGVVQYKEVLENAGHVPDFTAIQTTLSSIT